MVSTLLTYLLCNIYYSLIINLFQNLFLSVYITCPDVQNKTSLSSLTKFFPLQSRSNLNSSERFHSFSTFSASFQLSASCLHLSLYSFQLPIYSFQQINKTPCIQVKTVKDRELKEINYNKSHPKYPV